MAIKTRYCPTIELERTGIPQYDAPTQLKLTLMPSIDAYGDKRRPSIIEANIIGISTDDTDRVVYDGVVGNLGDLLVTHHDSAGLDVVRINENGEIILEPYDDDVNLYSRSREDFRTEFGQDLLYNDPFRHIGYATVIDENGDPVEDVWIQMKEVFNVTYVCCSDEDGQAYVRGINGHRYEVILAKKGIQQKIIRNWKFTEGEHVQFVYPQDPKTVWDGMYADTDYRMYVDEWDGGYATVMFPITVKDPDGNPVPAVVIRMSKDEYVYLNKSNNNGVVQLKAVDGYTYALIIAKSGIEQQYQNWDFTEGNDIIIQMTEKTTLDGMYAGTEKILYVDEWDGGGA